MSKHRVFLDKLSEVATLNIVFYLFSSIIKMSDAPGKDEAADGDEEDE